MTCVEFQPGAHICTPRADVRLRYVDCATCGRLRRFTMWCYEWYGPHAVCWGCGEEFNEDGRAPRPFARGWRQRNMQRARDAWSASLEESHV